MRQSPGRECGTFEDACQRAADFANRHAPGYACDGAILQDYVERFLGRAGWLHATFGVEYCSVPDNADSPAKSMAYLNTGDTYSETVICEDGKCSVSSWGDWYEQAEQDYEDEEGLIHCGYCGAFTDFDSENEQWHEVIFNHCGHCVAGG